VELAGERELDLVVVMVPRTSAAGILGLVGQHRHDGVIGCNRSTLGVRATRSADLPARRCVHGRLRLREAGALAAVSNGLAEDRVDGLGEPCSDPARRESSRRTVSQARSRRQSRGSRRRRAGGECRPSVGGRSHRCPAGEQPGQRGGAEQLERVEASAPVRVNGRSPGAARYSASSGTFRPRAVSRLLEPPWS
jgi:hypothetical protein